MRHVLRSHLLWCGLLWLLAVQSTDSARAQALRDGRRFDPGASMSKRAASAPEQLGLMTSVIGQWDVEYRTFDKQEIASKAAGQAVVTYMNRGHAIMERFHCRNFDASGNDLSTIMFLLYNPANVTWVIGEANSFTESIHVYNGDLEDGRLVLHNALRRGGGALLTHERLSLQTVGENQFEVEVDSSTDNGKTWQKKSSRTYTRRRPSEDFLVGDRVYGSPAPGLPAEAREFDFLIGEWQESHDMTFPNGQTAQWPANGTAVYALNGHGLLEFSWYDVDPRLPDAATSIVRLYNRQMRRWECMYSTNRFNSVLHFGGVQEGEQIVLHQFNANTSDVPISYWIFHDIEKDSYGWYAHASQDRGQNYAKTWIIKGVRKEPTVGR